MNRPCLFLSAVSGELKSARQRVAETLSARGFDVVSQDSFATGDGELRQWLRTQIDRCDGLLQIVGDAYGAEPPDVDAAWGRVSYTQFEFRYARKMEKKTWVIMAGATLPRDAQPVLLDLPDAAHPAPVAYQQERRQLQRGYVARLTADNHLRHSAHSNLELDNVVLNLRDDLAILHAEGKAWLKQDAAHKSQTSAQLAEIAEATKLTAAKIRAHLLETVEQTHNRELAEADNVSDWQQRQRQRLREAAEAAHAGRLARIDELASAIAEIEGKGTASSVFHEMSRILAEQGVDHAIAYIASQRSAILQTVRARASAMQQRNRSELQPLLQAAALYESKGQTAEARALYADVLSVEPDWPTALHEFIRFLVNQGDAARLRTTLADALRNYQEAHHLVLRLIGVDPNNPLWQWWLSVCHDKCGDVAAAQGQLTDAAHSYGEGLSVDRKLAAANPGNNKLQHNLSQSHNRLGDVAFAQGQLPEAALAYGEGLAIAKTLTAVDPDNLQWQNDLSVSFERLGSVAVARGQLLDAERFYGESLVIAKKLAVVEPVNMAWQRSLLVSYQQVGDMAAIAQDRLPDAARAYGESLIIAKKLVASDPRNTEWQRDLSVSHNKLGEVAVAQGDLGEAARCYGEDLKIAQQLAASDVANSEWQRDLWVSHVKLAALAERRKQPDEALAHWKQILAVLSGIEKKGWHLSPADLEFLARLRQKVGAAQ
ncbi:MAG: DUF4062 domain-containing protein [Rhodocyclaceae bacterium]